MARPAPRDGDRWKPPPRRGGSSRRTTAAKPTTSATPTPPASAPRQPVRQTSRRTNIPGLSAQARAQKIATQWDEVLAPVQRPDGAPEPFADIVVPTEVQRQERDERLAKTPQQVHMDPMEWWALEMARQGNDTFLFDYQPTPSINPPRPRTLAAGYTESDMTLRIRFRNGQVYGYYRVPPNVWRQFKRQESPGRFVNRVLNFYPYAPEPDLDRPTGMS
ncbi:KTSC domain-containing protein [Nonomuraea jabiensis]|uniref:KTSC domain-containing protein n=1 Tax=Nonomuraea jabiensis TaxID=882448 RepID=UPI00342D9D1C